MLPFKKIILSIKLGNVLKTTHKKHHTGEVKFPHFTRTKTYVNSVFE